MNGFIASCFGVALELLIIGGVATAAFGPLVRDLLR
jgi:uncharacterized membrane protein YeiH